MISIILCINTALFLLLGNFIINQRKQISKIKAQCANLEKLVAQAMKDYPLFIKADLSFAQQIRDINSQLVSMDNQLQELENKRDNDGGYQHALRILEMGGSKTEIIESCHLSQAEAELLVNLQTYRTAIKASV
jgi:hypothetical protein